MSERQNNFIINPNIKEPIFIDILQKRAELTPNRAAFTFYANGEKNEITFNELDYKVRSLASILQQKKLKGERALLLYPPGFDYIIGYLACLYSGVIAVPVYPPEHGMIDKTLPRLKAIINDSEAKVALSTLEIKNIVFSWKDKIVNHNPKNELLNDKNHQNFISNFEKYNDLFNLEWIATDDYNESKADTWYYPKIKSSDIAYLQYTSGSTGDPKGVIISHENILHNIKLIRHGFELFEDNYEGVIWLPIYHDMGLVGGILEPIFCGFHSSLISPIEFLKRPLKWLQIISEVSNEKKVVSGGPNFAYELCLRATNPEKSKAFDLRNWHVAFSGAEPIRAETIEKFSAAFSSSGFRKESFYPCYGLAEATLIVSGAVRDKQPIKITISKEKLKKSEIKFMRDTSKESVDFISSGREILDNSIKIIDPYSKKECAENQVGEIWTSSKSNALGYWKKTELSNETFNAFTSDASEGPFLRTGDLGFMIDGELFITGRLKDLIIIRGNNHYPQDIELTSEKSNNFIRPGKVAAFSVEIENEEKLVIVLEARAKQNVDWLKVCEDIKTAILFIHKIMPYKIVLIKSKTISLTSSGKIQRKATKEAFLNSTLDVIYEWSYSGSSNLEPDNNNVLLNDIKYSAIKLDEAAISDIIAKNLAAELKINANRIDKNLPFTDYGLDSAKSLLLVGELENVVDRSLEPTILWNYPTINKLSKFLAVGITSESSSDLLKEIQTEDEFAKKVSDLSEEEAAELLIKKLNEQK